MARRTEEGSDPNPAWTAVVGIIGAVLTLAIIVALQALYNRVESEEIQRKIFDSVSDELTRARSEQLETINSYRWVDEAAGVAGIPIEAAMEKVLAEIRAEGVAPRTMGTSSSSAPAGGGHATGTSHAVGTPAPGTPTGH